MRPAWLGRAGRLVSPLVAGFFLIVAAPLVVLLIGTAPPGTGENRALAPPPAAPGSWAALQAFPGAADAWVADHFGLRGPLIRLNNFILWHGLGELRNDRLLVGRNGRLFLGAHDGAPLDSLVTDVCGATLPAASMAGIAPSIRSVLDRLRGSGLVPTLLIVPTAARLYAEDLPARLVQRCAGHAPPADALAQLLAGPDVLYPLQPLLALKQQGIPAIPPAHFHWAGEAPLRIAEAIAEGQWGQPRQVTLPLRAMSRGSDMGGMVPGMGRSDRIREPQVRQVGLLTCVAQACAAEAGLPPGAAVAGLPPGAAMTLEHYRRRSAGPELLIIADSFGDEIARDFTQDYPSIWLLHTNLSAGLGMADRAALAEWMATRFRGHRVLLVYHDMAAVQGLGPVEALLDAIPAHPGAP